MTTYKAVSLMRRTDGPIGEDLKALVCQINIHISVLHFHATWVARGSLGRDNGNDTLPQI